MKSMLTGMDTLPQYLPISWNSLRKRWVIASVRNLSSISDIPGVKYTEGRFLPYFFPDTFYEGGDPVKGFFTEVFCGVHYEDNLYKWFSSNFNVEVHAYVKNNKYCVMNNTYEPQITTIYRGDFSSFELELEANEIIWYEI